MEYNKVAAKWWADKLRNIGPGNFNMGDDSSAGGIGMMLATMLALDNEPSSESIDLFEEKLAEIIKEQVEKIGSLILSTDYGPDYTLGKLANETGIDTTSFPWKTLMTIDKAHVSVSCGYGASSKIIFPVKSAK